MVMKMTLPGMDFDTKTIFNYLGFLSLAGVGLEEDNWVR